MVVLIVKDRNQDKSLLIKLHTEELIAEVKRLVSKREYTKAMAFVTARGKIKRKVRREELADIKAGLILSKDAARWDLMV